MRIFFAVFFLLFFKIVHGEGMPSMTVDSSIAVTIAQLDSSALKILRDCYAKAFEADVYSRLDTLQYDVAFIDATIRRTDSTFLLTERYFNADDSIPIYLFRNGEMRDVKKEYDYSL